MAVDVKVGVLNSVHCIVSLSMCNYNCNVLAQIHTPYSHSPFPLRSFPVQFRRLGVGKALLEMCDEAAKVCVC